MPALDTIEGLGDKAAEAVVDAAAKGRFLSKDDFRDRTKVSKTVIYLMDDMDLFEISRSPIRCHCLILRVDI